MVRNLEVRDAVPGKDVVLTIDAALQSRVYEIVKRERRAACVVLDVVLVCA